MRKSLRSFSGLVVCLLLCGVLCSCGGGDGSEPFVEKSDPNIYISGLIRPVNQGRSAIGSNNYFAQLIITDYSTGNPTPVTDATVTINGQQVPYSSNYGEYLVPTLNGTITTGSTFTCTITHPRFALSKTLTVPTATVPATYTITPLFDNASNSTVQNTTYTITPTAAWCNYGCITAYLYGTQTASSQGYASDMSLQLGAQFTGPHLTLPSAGTVSQYISFAAWNMDKTDLPGFDIVSSTPSRLRIWAPSGTTIAQNF